MRITDQMEFSLATQYDDQAQSNVEQATLTASSGLRVVHPWDDPAAAGLLAENQVTQARLTGIAATATQSVQQLNAASSALTSVSNTISSATQLAMQMADSSYTASQRASAGAQVDSYIQQIISALNTRVGDTYVFGGDETGSAPFDSSGNYSGDAAVREVEISPGVTVAAGVNTEATVEGTGVSGGVNILSTLQALATALNANDTAGIQAAIDPLNQGFSQVSSAQAQVGDSVDALNTAITANQSALTAAQTQASNLGDADMIQAATNLAQAQQALQASLSATSQSFQLTLLNYLSSSTSSA
jgi:flagellar hook-associated protein 3 FlgL